MGQMKPLSWILPTLAMAGCVLLLASLFSPPRVEDELRLGAVVILSPFWIWMIRQWWRDHKADVSFAETGDVPPDDKIVQAFARRPLLASVAYVVAALVGGVGIVTLISRSVGAIDDPVLRWGMTGIFISIAAGLVIATVRDDRRDLERGAPRADAPER